MKTKAASAHRGGGADQHRGASAQRRRHRSGIGWRINGVINQRKRRCADIAAASVAGEKALALSRNNERKWHGIAGGISAAAVAAALYQ